MCGHKIVMSGSYLDVINERESGESSITGMSNDASFVSSHTSWWLADLSGCGLWMEPEYSHPPSWQVPFWNLVPLAISLRFQTSEIQIQLTCCLSSHLSESDGDTAGRLCVSDVIYDSLTAERLLPVWHFSFNLCFYPCRHTLCIDLASACVQEGTSKTTSFLCFSGEWHGCLMRRLVQTKIYRQPLAI